MGAAELMVVKGQPGISFQSLATLSKTLEYLVGDMGMVSGQTMGYIPPYLDSSTLVVAGSSQAGGGKKELERS